MDHQAAKKTAGGRNLLGYFISSFSQYISAMAREVFLKPETK